MGPRAGWVSDARYTSQHAPRTLPSEQSAQCVDRHRFGCRSVAVRVGYDYIGLLYSMVLCFGFCGPSVGIFWLGSKSATSKLRRPLGQPYPTLLGGQSTTIPRSRPLSNDGELCRLGNHDPRGIGRGCKGSLSQSALWQVVPPVLKRMLPLQGTIP